MIEPIPIRKRRKRKLSDRDIEQARRLILRGNSLRSVAKSYKVDHRGLGRRLVQLFGTNYRSGHRTVEVLAEYLNSGNPRLAAAAAEFLATFEPTEEDSHFFTDRQQQKLTAHDTYYVYHSETFRARRRGYSCKVA